LLVRKVNAADDKRQAAELIELDGGDWARAARHSQGHMASLLKQAAPGLRLNEWACCSGMRGAFGPEH